MLRTTDAKLIGIMYLVTSFIWFFVGGFMALLMRAELAVRSWFFSVEQYNQLFTMHGTIMLLFFATPILFAFANFVVPLQIGAPDVSFPRLNALAYWLYAFGSTLAVLGFVTPAVPQTSAGRTCRCPTRRTRRASAPTCGSWAWRCRSRHHPRRRQHDHHDPDAARARHDHVPDADLHLEHPDHQPPGDHAFPLLAAALFAWRPTAGWARTCSTRHGGPMLWQHLFWFFGHPEVYIIALPFFGIISEIIPVFSRKPIFGYKGLVAATIAIAGLSLAVWAHHMFATGQVLLPFFSFFTFLIAVPTGMKFFTWIGTMWRGQLTFETPMLFASGSW